MWSFLPVLLLAACGKDAEELIEELKPSLVVTSPAPGAFVPDGDADIVGTTTGLTNLTVDGEPAVVVGTKFSRAVDLPRGISTHEVRGDYSTGQFLYSRFSVLAGEFEEADGSVADAAQIRLNHAGLDHLAGMLSSSLVAEELFATLAASNPIYTYYEPHGGLVDDTDVDVVLTALTFDPLQVTTSTANGALRLQVVLPDPYVEAETWGTIAYLNDTDGDLITISATEIRIEGDLTLDVAADGAVTAELANVVVSMPGFEAEWDYVWGVVDWLVTLFVDLEAELEALVTEAMIAQLPGLIGEALSALNTTYETELLGAPVTLGLTLADAQVDADGVVFFADLSVDVPEVLDTGAPGYLVDPNAKQAHPDTTSQMSIGLADDLVNRVLYEVWAGGMIELAMSTEDGSLDPLMLAPMGASEGTVTVTAGLPPIVVEQDGGLAAQLGEVHVRIDTPGGDFGNWLEVTLSGSAGLELAVEDNELTLGLGEPDLQFMVRGSDWGASDERLTDLLEEQVPVDVLLLLLGDFAFPLPAIEGFGIASATTSRDATGFHTDIAVTLE